MKKQKDGEKDKVGYVIVTSERRLCRTLCACALFSFSSSAVGKTGFINHSLKRLCREEWEQSTFADPWDRSLSLSLSLYFELRNCATPLFCCEAATEEEHRGRTLKFHNRLKSCALSQVVINKWDLYAAGRQNGDIRDLIYSSNHLQMVLFALTVFAPSLLLKIYYQNEWCTNLILVFVYTVSEALFY